MQREHIMELVYPLIADVAEKSGLRCVFIKGTTLHAQGLRTRVASVDVDVWVAPHDMPAFIVRLEAMGFGRRDPALALWHSTTLRNDVMGVEVDAHHYFPGSDLQPHESFEVLWANTERRAIGGKHVVVPNVLAHTLIAAMHALRPETGEVSADRELLRALEYRELVEATEAHRVQPLFLLAAEWKVLRSTSKFFADVGLDVTASAVEEPSPDWRMRQVATTRTSFWFIQISTAPWRKKAGLLAAALWPSSRAIDFGDRSNSLIRLSPPMSRLRRAGRGVADLRAAVRDYARYRKGTGL